MCECIEYSPDKDISLYRKFELESMLNRIREIRGEISRTSLLLNYPPFSEDELIEELLLRIE